MERVRGETGGAGHRACFHVDGWGCDRARRRGAEVDGCKIVHVQASTDIQHVAGEVDRLALASFNLRVGGGPVAAGDGVVAVLVEVHAAVGVDAGAGAKRTAAPDLQSGPGGAGVTAGVGVSARTYAWLPRTNIHGPCVCEISDAGICGDAKGSAGDRQAGGARDAMDGYVAA